MAINQITVEDVLDALEVIGTPASATAISQELDFAKKSAVVTSILESLVSAGTVDKGTSIYGFDTYVLAPVAEVVEEDEEWDDDEECCDDEDDDPCCDEIASDPIDEKLIENQREVADGYLPRVDAVDYEIPEDAKGYKIVVTDFGFTVTFPDNGQNYDIGREERVVVINNEYRAAVTTPEEILGSLQEYTTSKGYKHFVVRDMATGSALAPGRINMKPVIIFLEVERHNKAGF